VLVTKPPAIADEEIIAATAAVKILLMFEIVFIWIYLRINKGINS
jgi:hypothetical protein